MQEQISSFTIAGISVRTLNKENHASIDLGVLWERFYLENIRKKTPNRLSEKIYCVYTQYESDYTGKYTAIIGYAIPNDSNIPEGLTKCIIETGNYLKYNVQGHVTEIIKTWEKIWQEDTKLQRKYIADFEVYYPNDSIDIEQANIDIYIGV